MIAAGHSGTADLSNLSSCHWQLLKTHHHGRKQDLDDHCSKGQRLPRSRQRHSACRVGEFVYVFCGKDGTSPLKDIWKYHIYQQTWELVEMRGGSLPLLQGHTAVAYKRLIIIFGGTFNNNVNDIQLWMFNTDLGHLREVWGEPGTAQPLCRRDHSAVMHNNLMYIYGGFKDPTGATQELWAFNIDEEEWTEVTHLSHCRPSGRYGHSAVVGDGAMWVFGGTAGLSPCTDFWKYSFALHQWTKLKSLGSPPSPLSGHSACVIYHQMVVVGGTCRGKPMNDVWSYRFDTNSWGKLHCAGVPLPGLSFHICVSVSHHDNRPTQCTDRTLSTPHLKPSTSLLHPDRFVVRPHTSPSTMEQTAPQVLPREGGAQWASPDSQVMSLDELRSVTVELADTNSSNRADPRIDVSLKEPLMSDSPGTAGFYDSCIPFSPREDEDTNQELEVLQHMSPSQESESDSVVPDRTSGPGGDSDSTITIDLINLSDSPVLKASRHSFESGGMVKKEITFWNDLFIEDLEISDDGGLDEVRISYPSKNHLLPHPCPVMSVSSGVEIVKDTSLQHLNSSGLQQLSSAVSQKQPKTAENQHHCGLPDVGRLRSDRMHVDSTPLSRSGPGGPPLVKAKHQSQGGSAQGSILTSGVAGEGNQHRDDGQNTATWEQGQRSQCSLVNKDRSTLGCGQEQTSQDRTRNIAFCAQDSLEAETSFIDVRHSTSSQPTPQRSTAVPSHHTITGTTSITRADDSFSASSTIPRPVRTGGVTCGPVRRRGGEEDTKEEMVLEQPFLLVLGGKSEEQISIHPKPITVWKGLFA